MLLTIISGCLIVTAFGGKYLLQQQVLYESCLFIASVIGGLPIAIQAYQAAKVKVLSIDLLVTVAVLGALFIGEYNESAIVTFLFCLVMFLNKNVSPYAISNSISHQYVAGKSLEIYPLSE